MFSTFLRRILPAPQRRVAAPPPRRCATADEESHSWSPASASATEVKELNSLDDEAEIFLLMGRPDMACAVLRERADDSAGAPAEVWLRLLDVLRMQGLRSEFERRSREMKAAFNVELPAWETPDTGGARGLEDLPHVLEMVVRHWNNPGCLGYLRSLTRDIRDGKRAGFHFEAFRDLALLIGVQEDRRRLGMRV